MLSLFQRALVFSGSLEPLRLLTFNLPNDTPPSSGRNHLPLEGICLEYMVFSVVQEKCYSENTGLEVL